MTFLFPTLLTIGLSLAVLPVLLHMLRLQRQKVIRWAAMDFLLQSESRNRRWINLKQWLLLAARVAAFLLLALMVARPKLVGDASSWLPTEQVHHVVWLDDSFSMSEQSQQTNVSETARAALDRLAEHASQNRLHKLTLFRFSDALNLSDGEAPVPYVVANSADEFTSLRRQMEAWQPGQTAASLTDAIEMAAVHAASLDSNERVILHVVSDFRQRDVSEPNASKTALKRLRKYCAALRLVHCAREHGSNLSITELTILPSAKAADMELRGQVAVTNYGIDDVPQVTIKMSRDGVALPAIPLENISAGQTVHRQFAVRFDAPGSHHLVAEIESDAIEADNHKYWAGDLPLGRRVLIVDGSIQGQEGFAFASALQPKGDVNTGWMPDRSRPKASLISKGFDEYAAVLLLDAPSLEAIATQELLHYHRNGGGIFFAIGERAERQYYNQRLFAKSEDPVLPITLEIPTQTAVEHSSGQPLPLQVERHPIFHVFEGSRNSFLGLLRVHMHYGLTPQRQPNLAVTPKVIAKLGDDTPLVVESAGGNGRAICLLTTVARPPKEIEGWSNLSVSPVFPVLANELVSYLAEPRLADRYIKVGQLWQKAEPDRFNRVQGELEFLDEDNFTPITVSSSIDEFDWGSPQQPGVYRLNSDNETTTYAVNVDAHEGDLATLSQAALRKQYSDIDLDIIAAERFASSFDDDSRAPLYQWIGCLLLGLLALEQAIAYSCSYHAPRKNEALR